MAGGFLPFRGPRGQTWEIFARRSAGTASCRSQGPRDGDWRVCAKGWPPPLGFSETGFSAGRLLRERRPSQSARSGACQAGDALITHSRLREAHSRDGGPAREGQKLHLPQAPFLPVVVRLQDRSLQRRPEAEECHRARGVEGRNEARTLECRLFSSCCKKSMTIHFFL
jgi:hypothetical protein